MPLLVMRSYPETLLDQTCRMAVRRQVEYAAARGVPWGISESAYNLVDRHGNYQYKAFGVPGLGLKRGLADELVVAPYATALAAMVEPAARGAQPAAPRRTRGARAPTASTRRSTTRTRRPASSAAGETRRPVRRHRRAGLHGPPPGHDASSRSPTSLLGDPMVSASTPIRACRPRSCCCRSGCRATAPITQPRPVEETRAAGPAPAQAVRRFRSPHTLCPHAQFLSNGSYVTVVTNAGGGASFCRGRAVTRHREDATRDPGSQFLYLRDVRSGAVWSATHHPTGTEPDDYLVTFLAEKATFRRRRRRHRDAARHRGLDRGRRRGAAAGGDEPQRPPARDRGHELRRDRARARRRTTWPTPRSASCSSRRSTCPERTALLCARRPRSADEPALWAVHVLSLEGRTQGPVEWETDRARFLGRGRAPDDPQALDGRAALRHDRRRARPDRQPAPAHPPRARAASCGSRSRPAWRSRATRPSRSPRSTTTRARRRAPSPSPSRTRRARCGTSASRATRRCSTSAWPRACSYADRSLRAGPEILARNALGQAGLWPHGISGDLPILLVRVVEEDDLPLVRAGAAGAGVLAAQGAARRRRDPERAPGQLPRRDARRSSTALLDNGPWRAWKHRPAGPTCCAATAWARPSASCSRPSRAPC